MKVGDYHKGKVIDQFNYCDKWHQAILYTKGKDVVDAQQFDAILIGQGRNGARDVELTLHLENFDTSGNGSQAPDPEVSMEIYCFPGLGDTGGCDKENEGAAQYLEEPGVHYGMFSAKALNSTQNQNAGNDLGVWYGADRILDWKWQGQGQTIRDQFVVWIQ